MATDCSRRMSKILMIASEATPYAKTGGLADVVGSLPAALDSLGDEVAVLLPRYRGIPLDGARRVYDYLEIWLGGVRYEASIYVADGRVRYYFLDDPALYDRDGLYGSGGRDYPDNHLRFAVFCRAALALIRHIYRPDIIHCHDWQSALVPVYLHSTFANDPTFLGIKTLLTIHNLGYQGLFPKEALPEIGLDSSLFVPDKVEFFGKVGFLKGGLNYADALNTVSRTYAAEIQTPEYGFGLDGVLRARSHVLSGILNGVNYSEWSPENDSHIAAKFSADDLGGKLICKRDLLREFGLPEDLERPVLGLVSRFTSQKGADLIAKIASDLALEDLYLVALGTGDTEYETLFEELAAAHPDTIAVRVGFDNTLAHKIEAGADMFLMPSRYEPCGLNQIYSLRYGAIPIVHATGGLDDTIEEDTGFKFHEYAVEALFDSIRAALAAYKRREQWTEMMKRGMRKDFSWNVSAPEYSALYRRLAALNP